MESLSKDDNAPATDAESPQAQVPRTETALQESITEEMPVIQFSENDKQTLANVNITDSRPTVIVSHQSTVSDSVSGLDSSKNGLLVGMPQSNVPDTEECLESHVMAQCTPMPGGSTASGVSSDSHNNFPDSTDNTVQSDDKTSDDSCNREVANINMAVCDSTVASENSLLAHDNELDKSVAIQLESNDSCEGQIAVESDILQGTDSEVDNSTPEVSQQGMAENESSNDLPYVKKISRTSEPLILDEEAQDTVLNPPPPSSDEQMDFTSSLPLIHEGHDDGSKTSMDDIPISFVEKANSEHGVEATPDICTKPVDSLQADENSLPVSMDDNDSCRGNIEGGAGEDSNFSLLQDEGSNQVLQDLEDVDSGSNLTTDKEAADAPDTPATARLKKKRKTNFDMMAAQNAFEVNHFCSGFPAENLFEYQWPPDSGADWYVLQEQVSRYLDIKSFKRKYPELQRRAVERKEKQFLKEKGVVTETLCDLGLTALRTEEVYDLMSKDYPVKYQEYASVLHEREKRTITDKHKEYAAPKLDSKEKLANYMKKAIKSAAEYNKHFLQEKKEERRSYFDLQTMSIHYPRGDFRVLPEQMTKVSSYPVSLIPGQFQDYYKSYSSDELKYFPLKTAMYGPPKQMTADTKPGTETESSAEDTADSAEDPDGSDSSSSSGEDETGEEKSQEGGDDEEKEEPAESSSEAESEEPVATPESKTTRSGRKVKVKVPLDEMPIKKKPGRPKGWRKPKPTPPPTPKTKRKICKVCTMVEEKDTKQTDLIECSECGAFGHPSCLDLTDDMIIVIKTYPWQCMECKTCVECMDPYDEDKMMFCDKCDRGYHTFCVGVKSIPTGSWECSSCQNDNAPKPKKVKR